jgi:hypothetical protein
MSVKKNKDVWLVTTSACKESKLHSDSYCYHIGLMNIKTHEEVITYVEESFDNFKNWIEILDVMDASIDGVYYGIIVSDIKFTKRTDRTDRKVVNADSLPFTESILERGAMADVIAEIWSAKAHFAINV